MTGKYWQVQEAKNKFCSLVKKAQNDGPQIVTKHGKDEVVILSIEDYRNLLKPKESLIDFFKNSPLSDEQPDFERNKDYPRKVDL